MNPTLDHLVYVAPDLEAAIAALEARTGVRAAPGGRHPQWGTHNALMALGGERYLEILAPDPEAAAPAAGRPLGLDHLPAPRLATWAARTPALEAMVERARGLGVNLGSVRTGSRRRLDGVMISWRLTEVEAERLGGIVPFFIDWGQSPHPSASAPTGVTLLGLRAEHPEPERVRGVLQALELELTVEEGAAPALIATLGTPKGRLDLR